MTNIAWKNLVREKTRLAISVGGVAFAVVLILILRGLYSGITDQATEYIRSVDTDLWVAQEGTPGDFFHSVSLIPKKSEAALESVEGVARVLPLVGRPVVFRLNGADVDFFLLGIDPETGVGGPPAIEEGRATPQEGEIVVDRVFADNYELEVGDALDVRGAPLDIVGIARGGNTVASQFAWGNIADVAKLLEAPNIVNYFLVSTDGASPKAVADRIRREVPGTKPLSSEEFAFKNTADLREGFLPILWVLLLIAVAIGTAVIGLTIYTATIEKTREYGVLKALGFTNRRLFRVVYQQSLIAASGGFFVGTVISFVLAELVEQLLPSFVASIRPTDVALAATAAIAMALISSFVPLRPLARLDPAQVFRA